MIKFRLLCFTLLSILLIPYLANASPLEDYSLGKASVDVAFCPSLDGSFGPGATIPIQSRSTVSDWRATAGLGHDFAVQYRHFNPKSETGCFTVCNQLPPNSLVDAKFSEINLLHKINKNMSVFVGQFRADPSINAIDFPSKNITQFGISHDVKLTDDTHLYTIAALGNHLVNLEIGTSYELNKNVELNISYREVKVDSFRADECGTLCDFKFKGFGFGATVKL